MTPQHIGPEQKKQIELQLEKVRAAVKLKNTQIELKLERAHLYDELNALMNDPDKDGTDDTAIWAAIYALDAATSANDAELLRFDMAEMHQAIEQLETVLKAVGSGLVVATAQVPKNLGRVRG